MIQIEDLHFAYPKQPELFSGLSVELEPGSITGLLGKNGAGKTSLLKLIAGLLFPTAGNLSVLGRKPKNRDVTMLRDIFFVPEEFYFPPVTILDYCKAYAPFYPLFDRKMIDKILSEFGINAGENLQRISLGQKKKFLIAFALSTKCRLLILDEPTNGLDIPSKVLFRKILAGSLDENQLVIISTHQVKDVANLIDKIIVLDNGDVIFHQTIEEISQKVSFVTETTNDLDGCTYSESSPGGYRVMVPAGELQTELDIELLFNALTNGIKI